MEGNRGKQKNGKTRDFFKKIRNTKGTLYRGSDYTVMIIIQMQMQKSKVAVWGGLTNSWEKKRSKKQRRKGKTNPFECRVPKNRKER